MILFQLSFSFWQIFLRTAILLNKLHININHCQWNKKTIILSFWKTILMHKNIWAIEELQWTFTFQEDTVGSLSLNNLLGNTMFNSPHCFILLYVCIRKLIHILCMWSKITVLGYLWSNTKDHIAKNNKVPAHQPHRSNPSSFPFYFLWSFFQLKNKVTSHVTRYIFSILLLTLPWLLKYLYNNQMSN